LVPDPEQALQALGTPEHLQWAAECADQSITLVKEERGVLPLSPEKYKKVLFYDIRGEPGFYDYARSQTPEQFMERLRKEGFEVDLFNPGRGWEGMMQPYSAVTETYDLIIYLAQLATKSNQTVVRIEWAQPMGANVPIYMSSIPTIFISLENPYHLLDVPRVRTYINTYNSSEIVLAALVDKLMGRSAFKGTSPVDPFCGRWDTRL